MPLSVLIPLSLLPAKAGQPSLFYCTGALLLNLGFFYCGAKFALRRSGPAARQLLVASIIYIPSLFLLMSLPRG